ncbi:MAG TPA: hypothetical protein VFI95_10850 [Terriglobales bacterium]|nr:hypothetical protein [Terriglobales bacterium]
MRSNRQPTPGDVKLHTPAGDGSYTESVIHSFDGTDGQDPDSTLVFDTSGNLYVARWSRHLMPIQRMRRRF